MKKQFFTYLLLVIGLISCNNNQQKANANNILNIDYQDVLLMKSSDSTSINNDIFVFTDSIIKGEVLFIYWKDLRK